jgi:hypothetical protein
MFILAYRWEIEKFETELEEAFKKKCKDMSRDFTMYITGCLNESDPTAKVPRRVVTQWIDELVECAPLLWGIAWVCPTKRNATDGIRRLFLDYIHQTIYAVHGHKEALETLSTLSKNIGPFHDALISLQVRGAFRHLS